jgi:transposase InsO family protein
MRENRLLSPYRARQGHPDPHNGSIVTEAPNLMWGTDGTKVFMLEDGWVWVFTAVEHWNAECVGWHVTKHGDRYAALEPISQGLTSLYGSVAAEVARGLLLRRDHGSQYLSDHFVNQVRFWGIKPCFAFVEQPQTNGVVERFNRTLKEQAIYGKVLRNIEDVRRAVCKFVEDYNDRWRVEKSGFVSPRQARQAWFATLSQQAA